MSDLIDGDYEMIENHLVNQDVFWGTQNHTMVTLHVFMKMCGYPAFRTDEGGFLPIPVTAEEFIKAYDAREVDVLEHFDIEEDSEYSSHSGSQSKLFERFLEALTIVEKEGLNFTDVMVDFET